MLRLCVLECACAHVTWDLLTMRYEITNFTDGLVVTGCARHVKRYGLDLDGT
jgi:hypothetical protein